MNVLPTASVREISCDPVIGPVLAMQVGDNPYVAQSPGNVGCDHPLGAAFRVERALDRARTALAIANLWLASAAVDSADPKRNVGFVKWGDAWRNQPRNPAGNSDGGQWTNGDGGAGPSSGRENGAKPPVNDGVYRPGTDRPQITLTGGGATEEPRPASEPSPEVRTLEDIFPSLRANSLAEILLAPVDAFVGFSEAADAANLEATVGQYNALVEEIKRLDPSFADEELLPEGGIAGLSGDGRTNLIDGLRMRLAAMYYTKNGDIRPLQGETLMFLKDAVDKAYDEAVTKADADQLRIRLSREEAIGNFVDMKVRRGLRDLFSWNDVPYGVGQNITINNRANETTDDGLRYRIPDARLGNVFFDWTLEPKTPSYAQIRGYFRADSQPSAIIIIRPSQLGPDGTYLIRRPG